MTLHTLQVLVGYNRSVGKGKWPGFI